MLVNAASLRQEFADSVLQPGSPAGEAGLPTDQKGKKVWLLFDIQSESAIKQAGYKFGQRFFVLDYKITKLDIKFVNPEKREQQCTRMVLAEILEITFTAHRSSGNRTTSARLTEAKFINKS